ncbi:hypothetical protein LJC63_03375, partial [Ruminococcaceae bacterium OttesenSCG-928-L11]|nr:hypothetical protein [Ruminococcaceae bacterium OttesenSCG-928-L11]
MKLAGKLSSLLAAAILCLQLCGPAVLTVSAAVTEDIVQYIYVTDKNGNSTTINRDDSSKVLNIEISYLEDPANITGYNPDDTSTYEYSTDKGRVNVTGWRTSNTTLKYVVDKANSDGKCPVTMTLTNIQYISAADNIIISSAEAANKKGDVYKPSVRISIPDDYFYVRGGSSGGSDGGEDDTLRSEAIVENVIVTDSNGDRLDRVSKDSPPFNIQILYAD